MNSDPRKLPGLEGDLARTKADPYWRMRTRPEDVLEIMRDTVSQTKPLDYADVLVNQAAAFVLATPDQFEERDPIAFMYHARRGSR